MFQDDFHHIRIGHGRVGGFERVRGSDHVERWIIYERLCEFVDESGVDERFVALDVEDMGGLRDGLNGFGEPVGAGRVIR